MRPADTEENKGIWKRSLEKWGGEFCAEHDGSIPDFERLSVRFGDLEDYGTFFKRKRWNLKTGARIAGGTIAARGERPSCGSVCY